MAQERHGIEHIKPIRVPLAPHFAVNLVRAYLFDPQEDMSPNNNHDMREVVYGIFTAMRAQGRDAYAAFLGLVNDRGFVESWHNGLRPDLAATRNFFDLADPHELQSWVNERTALGDADIAVKNARDYLEALPAPAPSLIEKGRRRLQSWRAHIGRRLV